MRGTRPSLAFRQQDLSIPAKDRDGQFGVWRRTRGADDGQIGGTLAEQVDQFGIAMRLQADADCGIAALDPGDGRGQDEARLGMRGDQDQLAGILVAQVGRQHADVRRLGKDAAGAGDDLGTGCGNGFEALALAQEDLEAQLVLKLPQLTRNTRLGRMHALGGQGDVEAGVGNGDDVAQLGQGHGRPRSGIVCSCA
jgi:hypothetical protein